MYIQQTQGAGTMMYMAPEVQNEQEYSTPCDVWYVPLS
jgi:serine/threonine protein kinase